MMKRLARHGNSLALVLDRGVLGLLDIDAHTALSVTTDGRCLVITPVRDSRRRAAFRKALLYVNRRHGPALKKLAE